MSASPIEGMLIITLAAAPRAAASASSAATFRSLAALTLLRPASASATDDELEARLDAQQRDLGCVARRRLQRGRASGALGVRVAGHLHRAANSAVRRGVLVREGEEPIGEGQAGLVRPGVQVRVLDVLRATHRERRDHRHQRGAQAGGDGRGAAATRHRRGRAELADERVEAQVAKSDRRRRLHEPIVRLRLGFGDDLRSVGARRGTGAPRPVTDGRTSAAVEDHCWQAGAPATPSVRSADSVFAGLRRSATDLIVETRHGPPSRAVHERE